MLLKEHVCAMLLFPEMLMLNADSFHLIHYLLIRFCCNLLRDPSAAGKIRLSEQ